jgi:hypothetical protein
VCDPDARGAVARGHSARPCTASRILAAVGSPSLRAAPLPQDQGLSSIATLLEQNDPNLLNRGHVRAALQGLPNRSTSPSRTPGTPPRRTASRSSTPSFEVTKILAPAAEITQAIEIDLAHDGPLAIRDRRDRGRRGLRGDQGLQRLREARRAARPAGGQRWSRTGSRTAPPTST